MANVNVLSLVRSIQIWADRNGNDNQIYGDDNQEIILFNQKLGEKVERGEISNEDFKEAMGYCTEPLAENWQTSKNNNAKSVLETFAKDLEFEDKAKELKELLGEDNVDEVRKNRDFARPIAVRLKDGTEITYNRFREELSYKNDKVEKYYYQLDTGEFIEEIKEK